jgi:polyferredoxin
MPHVDREKARLKLLRLALGRPHRYHRYRAATMALTLFVLFVVPLMGLARFDLWNGEHYALFAPVDTVRGLVAVGAAIAAFYAVTFLINIPAGRMFCGFGCPIGQLSRFGDEVDVYARDPAARRRAWLRLVGFAAALSLAVLLWWTSPRVFLAAAPRAVAVAVATLVAVTAAAVVHARRWRWSFCSKACPIGLYYSVVQTSALIGIDYDPIATCTDCGACAGICPVHLDPRHLDGLLVAPGGLAFSGLPAMNHCLHCGECVDICEHMTRKTGAAPPMGFRRPRHRAASAVDRRHLP